MTICHKVECVAPNSHCCIGTWCEIGLDCTHQCPLGYGCYRFDNESSSERPICRKYVNGPYPVHAVPTSRHDLNDGAYCNPANGDYDCVRAYPYINLFSQGFMSTSFLGNVCNRATHRCEFAKNAPGDFCDDGRDCASGVCFDNGCRGLQPNSTTLCFNDPAKLEYACDLPFFCNSMHLCEPRRARGAACAAPGECAQALACVAGMCVPALSVPAGAVCTVDGTPGGFIDRFVCARSSTHFCSGGTCRAACGTGTSRFMEPCDAADAGKCHEDALECQCNPKTGRGNCRPASDARSALSPLTFGCFLPDCRWDELFECVAARCSPESVPGNPFSCINTCIMGTDTRKCFIGLLERFFPDSCFPWLSDAEKSPDRRADFWDIFLLIASSVVGAAVIVVVIIIALAIYIFVAKRRRNPIIYLNSPDGQHDHDSLIQ